MIHGYPLVKSLAGGLQKFMDRWGDYRAVPFSGIKHAFMCVVGHVCVLGGLCFLVTS